ncbi:3673_t:CDS:10, partial [Racocetra persica]
NLQISQLLDISPILEIKLRTANIPTFSLPVSVPSSSQKTSHQSFIEIDEEITILFEGGKVVSIDGKSLWTVLRICVNSGNIGIPDTPTTTGGSTSFAYKKWHFEGQEAVLDVVSCGPSISRILDQSLSTSASTALFPFQATARYIAVGSNPMLSYYATTDSSRPFYLAVSIASMVASKVTNAVFSLAKTLLTATGTIQTAGSDGGSPMANIAPATSIPLVLSLKDTNRKITKIMMSPAAADGKYQLAALTDSLGRVTLVDVEECEIIAMFKGIRNAQCGWVEAMDENEPEDDCTSPNPKHKKRSASKRITLFLVIYSPIRGVVEIHHMRHGTRIGNFSIGQGWNLITTASAPLGTSMGAGRSFYERGGRRGYRNAGLAKCFLIGPQGEIKRVHVPFECAVKKPVNLVNVFKNLLNKYESASLEHKDSLSQELMTTLDQMNDPKMKLDALMSLPDTLPPTFHLLATQSSIDCMGTLDSFDFLEFIHDVRDQVTQHTDQASMKLVRLKMVLRENLLHIYQTLEGWNVETCNPKDYTAIYKGNRGNVEGVFLQTINSIFGDILYNKEMIIEKDAKGIGPSSFMSPFMLKSFDNIADDGVFLVLDTNMDEKKKVQLGEVDFLFTPLIISTTPQEWIETVRKRIPISSIEWLDIFMIWFKHTSLSSLITSILKSKESDSNFSSLILNDFSNSSDDKGVLDKITFFCQNSFQIGHCLLLALAFQNLPSKASNVYKGFDWNSLITNLKSCLNLVKDIDPGIIIEIGLSASNLNKSEKTSSTRISSLNGLKLTGNYQLEEKESDIGNVSQPDISRLLEFAVSQAKKINKPSLKNAFLYLIWHKICREQASSIMTLVEKARKAPKDQLCVKNCGTSHETIELFLSCLKILFESFVWEPNKSLYINDILEVVEPIIELPSDVTQDRNQYLNDAFGTMIEEFMIIKNSADNKILSRNLVDQHLILIQVLLLIFKIEVRMVRPSKLFDPGTSFFTHLFIEISDIKTITSNQRIMEERMIFIKKLIEKSSNFYSEILLLADKFGLNQNEIKEIWQNKYGMVNI